MQGVRGTAPGSGTGGAPEQLELGSPSHSSLSGLKLMAKSWETWRARGEGAADAHPPVTAPGTSRAPRGPDHPLTSYLGGILAPKPRAENFLSL